MRAYDFYFAAENGHRRCVRLTCTRPHVGIRDRAVRRHRRDHGGAGGDGGGMMGFCVTGGGVGIFWGQLR